MSKAPVKYGRVGRADLLTLLHAGGDVERLAAYVGYEYRPEVFPDIGRPELSSLKPSEVKPDPVPLGPFNPTPLEFLFPSGFRAITVPVPLPLPVVEHIPKWHNAPQILPTFIPLTTSRTVETLVSSLIAENLRGRRVDAGKAVAKLASAQPLNTIPHQMVRRAPTLQIIADRSRHLAPFWADQVSFVTDLGKRPFTLWVFDELEMRIVHLESHEAREPNPDDGPIFVLGDLGAYATAEHRRFWLDFGQRVGRVGGQLAALAPCPSDDIPASLAKLWSPRPWEPPLASTRNETSAEHVEDLLTLASPVARLEPGLLRALRRSCTTADPTAELLVWRHAALASSNLAGATFKPEAASSYREKFHQLARQNPDRAKRAWSEIRAWRGRIGYEFMFEEILDLPEDVRECIVPTDDISAADRFWHEIGDAAQAYTLQPEALRWLHETSFRRPPESKSGALWGHPGAYKALKRAANSVASLQTRQLTLAQRGPNLVLGEKVQGVPMALLGDASGIVEILPVSDFPPPLTTFRDPLANGTFGPEMVSIPTGAFLMGSPETENGRFTDEGPQHQVQIDEPYALAKYPVTFDDYDAFCDASGRKKPDDKGWGRGRRPVINVTWQDAQAYCEWLSEQTGEAYRLPSEAEWEFACRANTTTRYWWGMDWDPRAVNGNDSGHEKTTEVGSYPANPWGLHDILGNVWEFCADEWFGNYTAPRKQAAFVSDKGGVARLIRGGAWSNGFARQGGSAGRQRGAPSVRTGDIGFRPARGQAGGGGAAGDFDPAKGAVSGANGQRPGGGESPPSPRDGHSVSADPALIRRRVMPGGSASLPLADLPAAPFVIRTDRAELVIQRLTRSDLGSWASGMGRDRFGLWADFTFSDIRQRLRFCPPGRFWLGATKEESRDNSLGLVSTQTEVTMNLGFWMFDTPVTQALYKAVVGENPSRFVSSTRPVERAGFFQAKEFLRVLNDKLPGLEMRLPSQKEWEYACRAGTTTTTYAGNVEVDWNGEAPTLDKIAWYGHNMRHKFELENGHLHVLSDEESVIAGTMPVKMKLPNQWGLFDMLGNVWEWCDGGWHGVTKGVLNKVPHRMVCGGSWTSRPQNLTSSKHALTEENGSDFFVGFRPARDQEPRKQAVQMNAESS